MLPINFSPNITDKKADEAFCVNDLAHTITDEEIRAGEVS